MTLQEAKVKSINEVVDVYWTEKMTPDQLEREIFQEIVKSLPKELHDDDPEKAWVNFWMLYDPSPARHYVLKAAADLCRQKMREVAEKAWDGGMAFSYDQTMSNGKKALNYTEWLKENNLLNDNE